MKSEEFVLQELEKEKQEKLVAEDTQVGLVESEKSSVKFMISGEGPVLMSKACELLIKDLSFRAWRHTERNRRRTLQRQDLHAAVGESEVYDFLIDIIPRVATTPKTHETGPPVPHPAADGSVAANMASTTLPHGMQVPNSGLLGGLSSTIGQTTIPPSGGLDSTNMLHHMQMQQHYQTPQMQYQQHQQHQQHEPMIQQNVPGAGQAQIPQQFLHHHQPTTHVTMP